MTWVDGILVVIFAAAAAWGLFWYCEAGRQIAAADRLREELRGEREAHEATRAAFVEERAGFLYDHRQLVSRRVIQEGVPPLDEPLRVESEDEEQRYDADSEEGVERALASLGGGRMRGTGRIASTRDDYDRLLTRRDELRARKRGVGTPPADSPYEDGERPLTPDDFAAIDDAAAH